MNARSTYALLIGLVLIVVSGAAAGGPKPPSWVLRGKYSPVIDKANFASRIDNRWCIRKMCAAFWAGAC